MCLCKICGILYFEFEKAKAAWDARKAGGFALPYPPGDPSGGGPRRPGNRRRAGRLDDKKQNGNFWDKVPPERKVGQ